MQSIHTNLSKASTALCPDFMGNGGAGLIAYSYFTIIFAYFRGYKQNLNCDEAGVISCCLKNKLMKNVN